MIPGRFHGSPREFELNLEGKNFDSQGTPLLLRKLRNAYNETKLCSVQPVARVQVGERKLPAEFMVESRSRAGFDGFMSTLSQLQQLC